MSNLPSMRLVSWNTELGVGVIFTSMPFLSKKRFSCATQIGQLKPPGKTIRLTVCRASGGGTPGDPLGETGARCAEPPAQAARTSTDAAAASLANLVMSPPSLFRVVVGQIVPHPLGDAPLPRGPGPGLL